PRRAIAAFRRSRSDLSSSREVRTPGPFIGTASVTGQSSSRLLVSHPHAAAFATGLARGLVAERRLSSYFNGLSAARGPTAARAVMAFEAKWPTLSNRVHEASLNAELRPLPAIELAARALGSTCRLWPGRVRPYDCLFVVHDYAVSWASWTRDTAA